MWRTRRSWAPWGVAAVMLTASAAAGAMDPGTRGDGRVDVHIAPCTYPRLILETDGVEVNGFIVTSAAGLLTGNPYTAGLGVFVTDADDVLADQFGYVLSGQHDLGMVVKDGWTFEQLRLDLGLGYTINGQPGVRTGTAMKASLGDANLDGEVGIADLAALADHYGQSPARWADGEFNCDDIVGIADLAVLADNYGRKAESPVPEPAAVSLLALGGTALFRRRRK